MENKKEILITDNIHQFQYLIEKLSEKISSIYPKEFDFDKNYQTFKKSISILAQKGWYIDEEMTIAQISSISFNIENNREQEANRLCKEYFDLEFVRIEKNLISNFPHRAKVLERCFRAHFEKDYYASIPIFYTQIEGVCEEITGQRFFSKEHRTNGTIPRTKKVVDSFGGMEFTKDLLQPLIQNDINRQNQDSNNPNGMNRHDVLHGQSLNYGDDQFNSYKCLSLLNYVGDFIYEVLK